MRKIQILIGLSACLLTAVLYLAPRWTSEVAIAVESDVSLVNDLNRNLDDIPPMSKSDVDHVLRHALNSKRSVVFVNVKWSLNSTFFRRYYVQFLIDFHSRFPDDPSLFYYVDCTQTGFDLFEELPGWDDAAGSKNRYFHGNGEILWLENGRLIEMDSATGIPDSNTLIDHTLSIFPDVGCDPNLPEIRNYNWMEWPRKSRAGLLASLLTPH